VAEIYDQTETQLDDLDFLRRLIDDSGSIKILEPFCGTGRILIPLALAGHTLVGMDQSAGMLERARGKVRHLPPEARERIDLIQADVLSAEWPRGFDLVILGCNCFYELAAPEEQEKCIRQAFQSLKPGGYLFIDNHHMEGELDPSWQSLGIVEPSLQGICSDGTIVESTRETVWFDAPRRLARFRRHTRIMRNDGNVIEQEYVQQKHPVSKLEVQGWLERSGFLVEGTYGSYTGELYTDASPRAIFWARRKE
jgi:SAM-dependent methyltransferase